MFRMGEIHLMRPFDRVRYTHVLTHGCAEGPAPQDAVAGRKNLHAPRTPKHEPKQPKRAPTPLSAHQNTRHHQERVAAAGNIQKRTCAQQRSRSTYYLQATSSSRWHQGSSSKAAECQAAISYSTLTTALKQDDTANRQQCAKPRRWTRSDVSIDQVRFDEIGNSSRHSARWSGGAEIAAVKGII